MEEPLFVGRETELAQLTALLRRGAKGQGGVAFVRGEAGVGKSMLLEALQRQVSIDPDLEDASFALGYCYETTGTQTAYQPFVEILDTITRSDTESKGIAKFALTLLKETAPDWLQIIPGIGPAVSAGIKTVTAAGLLLNASGEKQGDTSSLAFQYVNTIGRIADRSRPLVLVVENGHWIDEASCQLLVRLARRARECPLIVFLAYRPSFLSESDPLKRVLADPIVRDRASTISLAGLADDQVRRYVELRFKSPVSPHLADWLTHLCDGNPLFVSQYLSLLAQSNIIRPRDNTYVLDGEISYAGGEWALSANIPIPESVEAVLEERIQRLVETDRRILESAAVLGEQFMSTVLSQLLDVKEIDLLPQLRKVVEEHHLIRYQVATDQWTAEQSELYAFENALMHRIFYEKLSPRERVLYHRRVAEILEAALAADAGAPRKLVIEVAHHHDLGNSNGPAARYYWLAAQSSFVDGALTEAVQLAQRSLDKARLLREGVVDNDRLRAEVIHLMLIASEMEWRGKPDRQTMPLEKLVQEAEAAAARAGDPELIAQVRYLNGAVAVVTKSLSDAVGLMREALELAKTAGDPLTEFIIMSSLAHLTVGQKLEEGLAMLFEAHDLYQSRLRATTPADVNPTLIARAFHRLQSLIGVGKFDQGDYGEAMQWLKRSVEGYEQLKMQDYLSAPYNFLAQVYMAIGLFEDAEALLLKAIAIFKDESEPNAWNAINQALLGKLYMEWGRVQQAAPPLIKGWEQTQTTWFVAMVPLVRNYFAELLMREEYSNRDWDEAARLLGDSINEIPKTGAARGVIAALSLQSRLDLLRGRPEEALDYSTRATDYLKRVGMAMPALRTEEVLFNHYLALQAAGRDDEARLFLEQANDVLQHKASTLSSEDHRRSFLERVSVSRAIVKAIG